MLSCNNKATFKLYPEPREIMVTTIPPRPEYNRLNIPECVRQEDEFENYVLHFLFPENQYSLIERSYYLKLRDNITGSEFYIQCKHRFSLISNAVTFSKSFHADQYKIDRPVFFVLGLGGLPGTPNGIYMVSLDDCPYIYPLRRHLKNKSIDINQPVSSSFLWKNIPVLERKRKKRA